MGEIIYVIFFWSHYYFQEGKFSIFWSFSIDDSIFLSIFSILSVLNIIGKLSLVPTKLWIILFLIFFWSSFEYSFHVSGFMNVVLFTDLLISTSQIVLYHSSLHNRYISLKNPKSKIQVFLHFSVIWMYMVTNSI